MDFGIPSLTDLVIRNAWVRSFDLLVAILAIQDVCIGRTASSSAPAMRHDALGRKPDRSRRSFHDGVDIDSIRDKNRKFSIMNVADQPSTMEGLRRTQENSLRLSGIKNVGDIAIEETPANRQSSLRTWYRAMRHSTLP